MKTHLNTSTVNPAIVIQALHLMDEDAQAAIASALTHIHTSWIREALADAIRQQQEAQDDESRWLDREEVRHEFVMGRY